MVRYATNYGAGKVHLGEPAKRARFYTILYCTGRAMSGTIATTEAVTCKACLKRAKANGVDPTEVGWPG
jgi:hypothetical protein